MAEELKPCPWCAEIDMLRLVRAASRHGTEKGWIECDNCGSRGQTSFFSLPDDQAEAFIWNDWNTREGK